MSTDHESSSNRRTYIRLSYAPDRRPTLFLGNDRFDIIDISESGIRLHNPRRILLPEAFQSQVKLLCGAVLDVRAEVQWRENGEVGVSLTELIPADAIQKEQRHLILEDG